MTCHKLSCDKQSNFFSTNCYDCSQFTHHNPELVPRLISVTFCLPRSLHDAGIGGDSFDGLAALCEHAYAGFFCTVEVRCFLSALRGSGVCNGSLGYKVLTFSPDASCTRSYSPWALPGTHTYPSGIGGRLPSKPMILPDSSATKLLSASVTT